MFSLQHGGFVNEESIKRGSPFIEGEWKEHIPKVKLNVDLLLGEQG